MITKKTSHLAAAFLMTTALATGAAHAQQIDVWTLNFSSDAANEALQSIAEEFEAAHPDVDIVFTQRGVDEHKTALRVAAGSDSGPDIFFSWAGLGLGGEYVNAGMALPMDKYYEEYGWNDTLMPTAVSFADDYEGGLHGVPFTFKGEAIYYNKTLFEKAGITEEPTTYEELKAAAQKLKEAGIPAITFGGTVNWHVMRLMDVLLETTCGAEVHDQLIAMEASWSEAACAAEAFGELQDWAQNYFLAPFMGIDQQQSFNLFGVGRAAMMLEGNWLAQQIAEVADVDNFGIFPFPTGTNRLYGFAEYNYISAKSDNPDIAAQFLDFMNSKEVQERHLGAYSTNSVNATITYPELRAIDAEWNEIFAAYGEMFVNGDQGFPANVTTEYFRVINEDAAGNMTPEDASGAMQTFIDGQS